MLWGALLFTLTKFCPPTFWVVIYDAQDFASESFNVKLYLWATTTLFKILLWLRLSVIQTLKVSRHFVIRPWVYSGVLTCKFSNRRNFFCNLLTDSPCVQRNTCQQFADRAFTGIFSKPVKEISRNIIPWSTEDLKVVVMAVMIAWLVHLFL